MPEYDELTEQIIAAAIEVHRVLGPGLLESIYEEALAVELQLRGIECRRQVEVDVVYKGHILKGQRIDLLVAEEVIVETKSVSKLPDVAYAQILSYLKATNLRRGLILNFGCSRLVDGIKRVSLSQLSLRPLWQTASLAIPSAASAYCCSLAAASVLTSSIVTVKGPTPPGTGVMWLATWLTPAKSTSPTRPCSVR